AAGEAVTAAAGALGGSVAAVEKELVGGECAFWACMPSKTLLDVAHRRRVGADLPWKHASDRRDWMISREGIDYPDDASHVGRLPEGTELVRGTARVTGPGSVEVTTADGGPRSLEARSIIVAAGATPVIPPIPGLADAGFWTSRDGTSLRELPSSIVVLGGGPVGVELAQVYARFGAKTTIVEGAPRLLQRDHPNSSRALTEQLEEEGVEVRTGVRAAGVERGGAGRRVSLSDGSTVEGAELLVAVGRRPASLRDLGLEEAGVTLDERGAPPPHDQQLRIADGVFVAGDAAGGLQFTHVADYEGRIAAAAAMGRDARVDLSAVPRTTFTDPETAGVGLTAEEAREKGIDALEVSEDFANTSRGVTVEGARGHLTLVVDRERGVIVGAFAACPGASELIHEYVLAIRAKVPVRFVAETIHAFPTAARAAMFVADEAARQLA
ncbi:MAG TPA: NAD(P)/FAD-dependent oxidoreductase, partial [Actinomycetota bacterium]